MSKVLWHLNLKLKEALASVVPVALIVLTLSFTVAPLPAGTLLAFIVGTVLLIVGMGLFSLGAEIAMTPMGEYAGSKLTKKRNLKLLVTASFILGVIITIAEPDLTVLATQIPSIPNPVLIGAVSIGVGVFLVVSILRVVFQINLRWLLIGCYAVVFILSIFAPSDFIAVAFDSGGVTTGPITVPFIMAFAAGVASIRSDANAEEDGFGMVALCSVGPVLAVMILSMVFKPDGAAFSVTEALQLADSFELRNLFLHNLPHYMAEIAIALAPILIFFLIMQFTMLGLPMHEMIRIGVGSLYTFAGLVMFLTGANVGFMPVGSVLGSALANMSVKWLIIPIAMVIGYFIVAAEPAVHVLARQVADATDGAIRPKALKTSLSIGVAVSCGLAMTRVLTGISIYYMLVPGYAVAIILAFVVPPIFTAIAFDSGGVASGPMTATFLLPFAMGACVTLGGNVITDAFGVVAMVAMTPLITIQIMGLIYRIRQHMQKKLEAQQAQEPQTEETIIELEETIIELGEE